MATTVLARDVTEECFRAMIEQYWGLPTKDAQVLLKSLMRSRMSHVVKLRQHVCIAGAYVTNESGMVQCDWNHLAGVTMGPTVMMDVLEALCFEGRLSRQQTSRIENHILSCVNRSGNWKG